MANLSEDRDERWSIYQHVAARNGNGHHGRTRYQAAITSRQIFKELSTNVRPLPGAADLLEHLRRSNVPWAVATSGRMETAGPLLERLGIDLEVVPVVTRDQVLFAKSNPDLFLTAVKRLNVAIESAIVVGDSIWDVLAARRARALAVGLLSGGYGEDELERAGAFRVYEDPADLLRHLDEVGERSARA